MGNVAWVGGRVGRGRRAPCQPNPAGKILEMVTSAVTANRLAKPPFGASSAAFGLESALGPTDKEAGAEAWKGATCVRMTQ